MIGCGSKDSPTSVSPSAPPFTSTLGYVAVVAIPGRDGKSGVLTLTTTIENASARFTTGGGLRATVPALGSLVTPNNTLPMNGSYDTSTRQFAVSGGGYQLTATVSDDGTSLFGGGTQAAEPGREVMVAGVVSSTTAPAKAYCGYSSGSYCLKQLSVVHGRICEQEASSFRFVIPASGSGSLQGTASTPEGNVSFSGYSYGGGFSHEFTVNYGPGSGGYGSGRGSCVGSCDGSYSGGDLLGTSLGRYTAQPCS